jgi:hypothetical protein
MSTFPTLPIGPFEQLSMDYARLREEGIRLLGKLAGTQWTDFNTHDPGITILEQLCYAITDLGYRTAYPMPELLAGSERWLPNPDAILTTDPVTPADMRKLALDVDGIGNAWVEGADSELPFYYDAASAKFWLRADAMTADAAPVQMRGLTRIVVQTTDQRTGDTALIQAAARLHAGRGLGSDFDLSRVGITPVGMTARIEVGVVEDPVELMAQIVESIEAYLAPKARLVGVAEARAQGRALEDILDGPLLEHGFVETLPETRRTVYVSDLLHVILDVPAVKAVRSLVLQSASGGAVRWALDIQPGTVATLAPFPATTPTLRSRPVPLPGTVATRAPLPARSTSGPATELTLLRNDLPLRVDLDEVQRRLAARRLARAPAPITDGPASPPPPRQRDVTRHRSIQYQLPAAYGVGALGLPSSAPPERRAQARQLAAYLLIFDQLFANAVAQLSHAQELLSPGESASQTYFALPVDDDRLGLDELRAQDPAAYAAWLDDTIETGDPPKPSGSAEELSRRKERHRRLLERHKRFLAHLLARFAEELGDHARIKAAATASDADEMLVADRRAFLREYPWLSRARGSGYDVSRPDTPTEGIGGFEARLHHKLGLRDQRLHVVEHVLLRPILEDGGQLAGEDEPQVPLLAGVSEADPWSLHISVVLEEPSQPDASFEQFVAQTILAETPAHLTVRLHWFGKTGDVDGWAAFETAWAEFRAVYRDYRDVKLRGASMPVSLQLRMRDARDRVIDALSYVEGGQQLGFGRTYPLRDLPVPEQIVVTPGATAKIPIDFSQKGVTYELRDRVSGQPVPGTAAVDGTGEPIELVTPSINVDTSYRILAVKREGAQSTDLRREAWLRTIVRVVEGVDSKVQANILLPLLDSRIDNPKPTDARLGNWGVQAEVEILDSQEGVTYILIEDAKDLSDPAKDKPVSVQPVIGTSGRIVLRTKAITEDIDLRIRGSKTTGTAPNIVNRTAVLDIVLLLRVRANPALSAQLAPSVVAYGAAAVVRLATTQASAGYRVYRSRVRDSDFVFDTGTEPPTIDVAVDGRTVRVKRPPKLSPWQDVAGFAPAGDATRGNGGPLDLAIGAPGTDDAFLLVQATKQHDTGRLGAGSETIASAVQLDRALALLVRPNPAQALHLEVAMATGATTGTLLVSGGQPGVFYEFRLDGQTQPIARPAYFHQRDDQSAQLNKGIEQLRIEVDAVIARDRPALTTSPATSPATTPPLTPLLDTAHLPAGSVLRVLARKAMSGLEAPLDRRAVLDDMPAVTTPAPVTRGASADIVIETSRQGERYGLLRNGQPVGDVQVGTGARIALPTGAVEERTVFTVAATRPDAQAIEVERHVDVVVDVV